MNDVRGQLSSLVDMEGGNDGFSGVDNLLLLLSIEHVVASGGGGR